MLISCIMPTYNRYTTNLSYLVEEAVESFLRQTVTNAELVIVNDTPTQKLHFDHPRVRILNTNERFFTLSDKLEHGIRHAQGELLCRWDDDDIHLPWRLETSLRYLEDKLEWRASNHWNDSGHLREVDGVGNSHTMSLWRREVLDRIGGYPSKKTGNEDQEFNKALAEAGINNSGQRLEPQEIYYLYRWATGSSHLSGKGDQSADPHQSHWNEIGQRSISPGVFTIKPRWTQNHVARVQQVLRKTTHPKDPLSIQHYFNYQSFYDWVVRQMPVGARMVEVGCLSGASTCYLANKARDRSIRIEVIAVDMGVGVNPNDLKEDYVDTHGLLTNIAACGCQDMITPIIAESTKAARLIPDKSVDFLFLDAGHEPNDIRSDLQAWAPKVKEGGIYAGHDYIGCGHPAVAKEVDEFFGVDKWSLAHPLSESVWCVRM